jgi:hypothetical protein
MRKAHQVLLLRVEFAFELEHANHAIGTIVRAFQRPMWKCMHGKRTIAFVVITDESSVELVKRLGLDQIGGIENYWCHVAPIAVVAKHGNLDSLDTAIDKAWDHAGKRHNPEYMRQAKRSDPYIERRVKHGMGGASVEMRIEPGAVRKSPQHPNDK